jgi:hypothetical protein
VDLLPAPLRAALPCAGLLAACVLAAATWVPPAEAQERCTGRPLAAWIADLQQPTR